MRLILRHDVEGVGRTGDVVDVAKGYARNYLLPKGLAMRATSAAETRAVRTRQTRKVRTAAEKSDAEEMAVRLAPAVITIEARAADTERLFGAVHGAEIASAIEEQLGLVVERKAVEPDEAIKTLGEHMIMASLHPEVVVPVRVSVVATEA